MATEQRGRKAAAYHGAQRVAIGERLRRWRMERNLSTGVVAARIKVSPTVISGWETGGSVINLIYARRLCDVLGYTLNALMEDIPDDDE